MKYLLCGINAKYIHSNLAVHSLGAYARARDVYGAEILVKEYTINQYVEDILADLYEEGADVLILSCYLWNISHVLEIAAEYHKIVPEAQIWLGGPEVSYNAREVLEDNPAVSLLMRGEGEETFFRLVRAFEKACGTGGRALKKFTGDRLDFAGIAFRHGEEIIDQGMAPPVDMDQLPFVYEDFKLFENRIIYYESSRGCPYQCSYCLSSEEKSVRFRSLDKVYRELDLFLEAGIPQVKFTDRTFNCRKDHAMGIWSYLTDHDNGVTNFHFEIAGHLLDQDMLALFARMRPGLIQLEIGLQSLHERTLQEIRRNMDVDELFMKMHSIRQNNNIHQHLDLIAGLPYESYEEFGNSFTRAFICLPDQLQLGFLKVLKGTLMERKAEDYGIIYRDKAPYEVMATKWISYGELLRLKRIEDLLETYYNSGQYYYTLKYVIPFYETPFVFFERFADWYHKRAYDRKKHTRLGKCNLLHDFVLEHEELRQEKEVVEDILLYDWYLKEHSRVRPDWAPDLSPYKNMWKDLYRFAGSYLFEELYDQGKYDSKKAANRTHWDYFGIDMDKLIAYGEVVKGDFFCLFDYDRPNPLDHAAKTLVFDDKKMAYILESCGEMN